MDALFASINYKDPLWIAIAFAFGTLSRVIGLPPLVGFLVAGFALNYAGAQGGDFLNEMADLGITLLLFTIGLKLKIKELAQAEVWGTALSHMVLFGLTAIGFFWLFKQLDWVLFKQLAFTDVLILSFALSFSSTVFVVKSLEEHGDLLSKYGQIAIGILIIQDLVAVLYLGISEAKVPSMWATLLIACIVIFRPLIIKLTNYIGHGELLILFGLSMALGGAALFDMVDMKGDLGALIFGVLLANTARSDELAKALFGIKELFLVGFFLSIGMAGLPTLNMLLVVAILLLLLAFKSALYFGILSYFKVETLSATRAAIGLNNFSEFGLIVIVVAVSQQWINTEWLTVMSLLVAVSFVISTVLNHRFDAMFIKYKPYLARFERQNIRRKRPPINIKNVEVMVCGMGRVGSGAYEYLATHKRTIGIDYDKNIVIKQKKARKNVRFANVSSIDFWSKLDLKNSKLNWLLLCFPNVEANKEAAILARTIGFKGYICAAARYPDEEKDLLESGIDNVFNIYQEAGAGLAQHGIELIDSQK